LGFGGWEERLEGWEEKNAFTYIDFHSNSGSNEQRDQKLHKTTIFGFFPKSINNSKSATIPTLTLLIHTFTSVISSLIRFSP
jgi:hypothetical protein